MKNTKKIQVSGKAAEKLREIAAAKAAKLKAMDNKPKQDLCKMPIVG